MTRFKKLAQEHEGRIVYGDSIVDDIVLLAVREIPYVELFSSSSRNQMSSNAIKVRKDWDDIHVDVNVKIHYSQSVSDMSFKIQEAVRHAVETMTEYHVASVNVKISGVIFDEKVEEHIQNTIEDNKEKEGNV